MFRRTLIPVLLGLAAVATASSLRADPAQEIERRVAFEAARSFSAEERSALATLKRAGAFRKLLASVDESLAGEEDAPVGAEDAPSLAAPATAQRVLRIALAIAQVRFKPLDGRKVPGHYLHDRPEPVSRGRIFQRESRMWAMNIHRYENVRTLERRRKPGVPGHVTSPSAFDYVEVVTPQWRLAARVKVDTRRWKVQSIETIESDEQDFD